MWKLNDETYRFGSLVGHEAERLQPVIVLLPHRLRMRVHPFGNAAFRRYNGRWARRNRKLLALSGDGCWSNLKRPHCQVKGVGAVFWVVLASSLRTTAGILTIQLPHVLKQ